MEKRESNKKRCNNECNLGKISYYVFHCQNQEVFFLDEFTLPLFALTFVTTCVTGRNLTLKVLHV